MPTPLLYTEILKFGSERKKVGLNALLDHLNNKKIFFDEYGIISVKSVALKDIIESNFIDEFGNSPTLETGKDFYLKSDALAFLINYELMYDLKKESLKTKKHVNHAIRISANAFKLSLGALIVSIVVVVIRLYLYSF